MKLSRVPAVAIALGRIVPAAERKSGNETVMLDAETAGIVSESETAIDNAKKTVTVTVIANVTGTEKRTVTASVNETGNAPAATELPPPTATTPPATTPDAKNAPAKMTATARAQNNPPPSQQPPPKRTP